MSVVVIGIGNDHRRDDGVGPAVAAEVARQCPGVPVMRCAVEPAALIDAWDGADLAMVIDAAAGEQMVPGRVRRCGIDELAAPAAVSSHDLNLAQTYELAMVLGRAPRRLVVVSVDVADVGYGTGLSCTVAQAVPHAVAVVRGELDRHLVQESADQAAQPAGGVVDVVAGVGAQVFVAQPQSLDVAVGAGQVVGDP